MDLNQIDKTASLSSNNALSLMVFKVTEEKSDNFQQSPFLGINIFKVKEVLNFEDYKLSQMPQMDSERQYMLGLINVRGDYIPVYDTTKWLGYPGFNAKRSVVIVAEINQVVMGLHVAYIHGVFEKSWDELKKTEIADRKIISETRVEDELCLVVDVEQMIADIQGQDLQKESQSSEKINTNKVVLFADDSKSIRDYVTALFNQVGVKHMVFEDGSGLIKYLENQPKDVGLILTDLEMPNTSGHTVIKFAKSRAELKGIPVIVHSSMTVGDSKRQAKELGADDFIGKIDTDGLVGTLKKYLS